MDRNEKLYVTDSISCRVIEIDTRLNQQKLVTKGRFLAAPVGIGIESDDSLMIGDPDAFSLLGGLVRVDKRTGRQTPCGKGSEALQNYRGVAVMPTPSK